VQLRRLRLGDLAFLALLMDALVLVGKRCFTARGRSCHAMSAIALVAETRLEQVNNRLANQNKRIHQERKGRRDHQRRRRRSCT